MDSGTLLRTKLYAPEPRADLVMRPRLIALLNEGLRLNHRLSLICAPAGYGKSTLVSQWLDGMGNAEGAMRNADAARPFGWLTLDEADNDIARFLAYLIAAIQQADPSIGQATQTMLGAVPPPPVNTIAVSIINEMVLGAGTLRPLLLVLDDYQQIQAPTVHQLVEYMVEHAPPHFRLLIITREDPPFALSRLRVRGQLTELREADLRFTPPEAASFLNETMRLGLSGDEIVALDSRTEGWIAGLQLAGLSLRDRGPDDRSSFVAAFSGSHRYIIDYLVDEVLRRQPEELRRFLCQTSILNRFCPPLCDAVTGHEESREVLAHLDQANLFVIPLDNRREWYRYHRLFADCLGTLLTAQERACLHRRAAGWLAEHGLAAEAARHALAGGEDALAARLVSSMAPELMARGELEGLLGWLDALPQDVVLESLDLAMYRAWTLFLTGRLREAAVAVTPMRARLPGETDPAVKAQLLVIQSWLANFEDDILASARLAGEALDLTGGEESLVRVLALDLLGEAQVRLGEGPASSRSLREGVELAERLKQPFAAVAILYNLAMELNRQGRRREAISLCTDNLKRYSDRDGRPLPVVTQLYIPLAWLHYEANELAQARQLVRKGLESRGDIGLNNILLVDGPWLEANLDLDEGDGEHALAVARQACREARETGYERVAYIMAACEALAQLRMGDAAAAVRWAVDAGLWDDGPSRPLDPARELTNLTLAEMLLATGRLDDARALLGDLEQSALEGERYGRLIRIHLLQSATELAASSESGAVRYLERALASAAPEGYVRAFLDEGATVAGLLPQLRRMSPTFVEMLIKASAAAKCRLRDAHVVEDEEVSVPQTSTASRVPGISRLDDPLSEQEMRILRLLAAGMSNQEIAGELVVTVGTVKWHVHNIYGKLGAGRRAQAIARARQLGLPV